jgi:hypothetical protein
MLKQGIKGDIKISDRMDFSLLETAMNLSVINKDMSDNFSHNRTSKYCIKGAEIKNVLSDQRCGKPQ